MAGDLDDAEERCLEAEAWADEISAWGREHEDEVAADDAMATARMVTAIVKSIRLSVVAGEDRDTREMLLEELDQLLQKYRSPASSGQSTSGESFTELDDLPATKSTIPPPPGHAPEDIWKMAPRSVRGKPR